MSTSNPNYGVGGTAKDGGLSTAATVADGGPDDQRTGDGTYVPDDADDRTRGSTTSSGPTSGSTKQQGNVGVVGDYSGESAGAKPSNKIYGVGGTDDKGGVSTADTVADGGPDEQGDDGEYKPS